MNSPYEKPKTKQDLLRLIRENIKTGRVTCKKLSEENIPTRYVYSIYDSLDELNDDLGRGEDTLVCGCGVEFGNLGAYRTHNASCKEEEKRKKLKIVEGFLNRYDISADYFVYVLEIKRETDGAVFWYVGMTKRIEERLLKHLSESSKIELPNEDGSYQKTAGYSVEDLSELHTIESKSEAKDLERRRFIEIILEKKSKNVVGGK